MLRFALFGCHISECDHFSQNIPVFQSSVLHYTALKHFFFQTDSVFAEFKIRMPPRQTTVHFSNSDCNGPAHSIITLLSLESTLYYNLLLCITAT